MFIPKKWKMITRKHTILEPFAQEAWKKHTFGEVKKLSHNKSDNYVHTTLKRFVASGVLQEQKIGNIIVYSLTRELISLTTVGFVAEHRANAAKYLPHRNIQKLINKIKTAFYIFIVTGSYAKMKQKETSDLDIVIICDNRQEP